MNSTSRPACAPSARILRSGPAAAPLLLAGLLVLAARAPAPVGAQVIPVKTVPLATGDQFLVHPSSRLGMAALSAALADTVGDPFVNPAKGARLRTGRVLANPTLYHVTEGNGGGRTLPVGALLTSGSWFGGLSLAIQEIVGPEAEFRALGNPRLDILPGTVPGQRLDERSSANTYLSGLVGRRLGDEWAVGGAVRWAGLAAVDGVEHLYPGALGLEQSGSVQDYRLGAIRDPADGTGLEAVLVHRRFDARHVVRTVEVVQAPSADACAPDIPCREWAWRPVEETNLDRTNTTGLHLGWVRALDAPGWRLGGFLTGNRKDHPKIPNYDLMNIPRDPGTTWAWNLGVGVARSLGETTWGIDAAFEPVWTETWAEAEAPVTTARGTTIPRGGRTVDNDFFFHNVDLRFGGARAVGPGEVQLGLVVRSISYELEQTDHVEALQRRQRESWMEWTPTWSASLGLEGLTVRYQGRLTTGTGRPGVTARPGLRQLGEATLDSASADFLPAPTGPLTLQDARVWTHRIALEVPIG